MKYYLVFTGQFFSTLKNKKLLTIKIENHFLKNLKMNVLISYFVVIEAPLLHFAWIIISNTMVWILPLTGISVWLRNLDGNSTVLVLSSDSLDNYF